MYDLIRGAKVRKNRWTTFIRRLETVGHYAVILCRGNTGFMQPSSNRKKRR